MTCSTRTFWFLILTFGVAYRLTTAAVAPLFIDEAYALTITSQFSWSFFDHPPLSLWVIDAMYRLTGTAEPFVLRIPAIVLGFGTMGLIYAIGKMICSPDAGRLGVVVWLIAPRWSRVSGVFAVPDPFITFFSILCVWFVARTFTDERPSKWLWVGAGVALAGALASKYHAALLVASALLFAICHPRARVWFRQPGPYIACAIALVGLLPVLIWNLQHDWASFRFHSGRAWSGLDLYDFFFTFRTQLAWILTPYGTVALIFGIVYALRHRRSDPVVVMLLYLSLPSLVIFNAIYLFSDSSHAHWTMQAWLLLLPVAGMWLTTLPRIPRFVIVLVIAIQFTVAWTDLMRHVQTRTDRFDATMRLIDDDSILHEDFDYRPLVALLKEGGYLNGKTVIAIPGWDRAGFLGAALRPAGIDLGQIRIVPSIVGPDDAPIGGPRFRMLYEPNHFRFMAGASATGKAIYINPVPHPNVSRQKRHDVIGQSQLDAVRELDPNLRELPPIILKRGNTPHVIVYLATFTWPDDSL